MPLALLAASSSHKCPDKVYERQKQLHQPILGAPERCPVGASPPAAGVGQEARELREMVRQPEARRLRADALRRAVRGEHLLGGRHGVDAGAGRRRVGVGAPVVQLPVQHLRGWAGLWALYADCVEGDEEDWVC